MASSPIRLGPLVLTRPVGRGGTGTVWHARHPEGVDVAVKVLRPEYAGNADVLEAFRREVRSVASMDHPAVVRIYDYGVVPEAVATASEDQIAPKTPWMSMEYAVGGTLGDHGAAESWPELRDTVLQILDGLAHSHARGIVHRDLKPRNVLLHPTEDGDPRVTLTDYGIAHALSRRTAHKAQAGTPGYMAPEQIHGDWRDLGPATDLYSLGALTWRLATGKSPFQGDRTPTILYAQINGRLGALEPVIEVPAGFEGWVRRLLEVDPADRWPSAADAAGALVALEWGEEPEVARVPPDWRPRHPPTTVRPNGTGLALFVLRPWPLVGRDRVQDALWAALRDVSSTGRAECVVLSGARGAGKSRLAAWLAARAVETGSAWVLRAQGEPSGSSRGGSTGDEDPPLVRAARAALRLQDLEPDAQVARVVGWLSRRGSPRPEEEAREIVELLGPRTRKRQPKAWLRLLDRMAHDRPLILVADDVHDDLEAAALVRALIGTRRPVLAIATLDRAATPPPGFGDLRDLARWFELEPLSPEDQRRLVDAGVGLEPRLADQVLERTHGDPGLAVKIVTDWARRGLLVPTSTGFRLEEAAEARMNEPLLEVLDQRLQGCPDQDFVALEVLAVLGASRIREEEWRLVCEEAGVTFPADTPARLAARGVLTAVPDAREADVARWTFDPPTMRDVLLQRAASGGRLKRHHEHCGSVLLREPRASARERAVMHFVDAGLPNRALTTLRSLIEETERQGQWRRLPTLLASEGRLLDAMRVSATDHRRLPNQIDLALHELAEDVPVDPAQARRLLDRAVAFGDQRLCARAARVVLTLEDQAERLDPEDPLLEQAHEWHTTAQAPRGQATVALLHARAAWRHHDPETAERELNDALGLTDVPLDRARILALLGEVKGDEDGDKQMAKARTALQVSGKPAEAAQVELTRARVARRRGDLVAALERARTAQAELRKLQADTAPADLQVGLVRLARGELTQARAELTKAADAQAPGVALVARGALLACTPAGPDWGEFDARLGSWRELADDDVGIGADSAWPLEWAAKRVADAGAVDRAVTLYEIAARRFTLAGDPAGAERMQKRVRQVTLDAAETVLRSPADGRAGDAAKRKETRDIAAPRGGGARGGEGEPTPPSPHGRGRR